MRTAAQFKKAFEAYIAKPATEQNPLVAAALKQSSDTATAARETAGTKRDALMVELKKLVANKPLSPDATLAGKELNAELAAAFKTGDYAGAVALMDEIEALVTDDTGATTGALDALRDKRTEEADKVLRKLGLRASTDPDKPGGPQPAPKTTAKDRAAKSDDLFPDLKALMAKRTEAVAWQQDEIAAVDQATAELARLGKTWATLLEGIMEKRAEVAAAVAAQEQTDADILKSEANEKEAKEMKTDAEQLLPAASESKKKNYLSTIADSTDEIAKEQLAQVELKKLKAAHPQTIAAKQLTLNTTVDTAQATLTGEAAKIAEAAKTAAKGAPKQGMGSKNPSALLIKLGLNLVPQDLTAVMKDMSAELDPETVEIGKLFPELHLVAEKHGSGRHGVQTGLDRQAGRTRSGMTPDQPGDAGGLGEDLFGKGTNKQGKDGWVDQTPDPARKFRLAGTQTASMFLSPELEKQAVDTAIKIATTQCKWAEIKDKNGPKWKPLTNMLVELGPPPGLPGWGVAISRIDGDGKTDPALVAKTLDEFRNGKIDFDGMLKQLNAKLGGGAKTDAEGKIHLDVNFVMGVSIAVNRVGGGWINTTQFPTPPPATAAAWSLAGETVRIAGDTGAGEVCAEPAPA
jgi:hypothetical protein